LTPHDALDLVLGELCDLAAATEVEPQARDLLFRRRAGRLRIAVVGEAKRGKSTLLRIMAGQETRVP
jgi:ATPase subunit of ABC transporter with duplicated ATPase domains